jgi:hypothetical protein
MGDHSTETLEHLLERQDEQHARELLERTYLYWDEDSMKWILNHIDCFVSQSRGNESVEEMVLHPYALYGQGDEVWDKVGQAIGNLQALKALRISTDSNDDDDYYDNDNQVGPNSDWGGTGSYLQSYATDGRPCPRQNQSVECRRSAGACSSDS